MEQEEEQQDNSLALTKCLLTALEKSNQLSMQSLAVQQQQLDATNDLKEQLLKAFARFEKNCSGSGAPAATGNKKAAGSAEFAEVRANSCVMAALQLLLFWGCLICTPYLNHALTTPCHDREASHGMLPACSLPACLLPPCLPTWHNTYHPTAVAGGFADGHLHIYAGREAGQAAGRGRHPPPGPIHRGWGS